MAKNIYDGDGFGKTTTAKTSRPDQSRKMKNDDGRELGAKWDQQTQAVVEKELPFSAKSVGVEPNDTTVALKSPTVDGTCI